MKVNKTQALLFMYEYLLNNGSFSKEEIVSMIEISTLTFLRYIQELRAYIYNFNIDFDLMFYKKSGRYFIQKKRI